MKTQTEKIFELLDDFLIEKGLTKEEVVYEWIMNGKLKFVELASLYVQVLEWKNNEKQEQLSDLVYIASMYREPKLNGGSKELLETRYAKAMIKSKIYKGTEFEKELEKLTKD